MTAQKRRIKRPTSPRWEVDLLAYKGDTNEVLVVECKSLLDSRGVTYENLVEPTARAGKRYKLFRDENLRETVFDCLSTQLTQEDKGSCAPNPKIRLCLAAGNIPLKDRQKLKEHFEKNKWELIGPDRIRSELEELAHMPYENKVAVIAAKMLVREKRQTGT